MARLIRLNEVKYVDNELHIARLLEEGFTLEEIVSDEETTSDEEKTTGGKASTKRVADNDE